MNRTSQGKVPNMACARRGLTNTILEVRCLLSCRMPAFVCLPSLGFDCLALPPYDIIIWYNILWCFSAEHGCSFRTLLLHTVLAKCSCFSRPAKISRSRGRSRHRMCVQTIRPTLLHRYTDTSIHLYIDTCTYISLSLYIYIYTYVYVYIYIYTCLYIYIYIQREREVQT